MPCVSFSGSAYLYSGQMPSGSNHTVMAWVKASTASIFQRSLGMGETATINASSGDVSAILDTNFQIVSAGFGFQDSTVAASTNTWYFYVLTSRDSGTAHRLRIFADDGSRTKVADFSYTLTTNDKRYLFFRAEDGTNRYTAAKAVYGSVLSDANCRSHAVTRGDVTISGVTTWETWPLTDHTDLTGSLSSNDLTGSGTLTTEAADEPAALAASSAAVFRIYYHG
jgi:hypothetical protein